MYSYDEENNMFFFTDDLTKYLLKYGISIEHINKMKTKILENDRDTYQKFPSINSPERDYVDLIPMDKVIDSLKR